MFVIIIFMQSNEMNNTLIYKCTSPKYVLSVCIIHLAI